LDEFSLIQRYFSAPGSFAGENDVILGIGDDTAILKVAENEELLVTTDTLISGVHFPKNTDPRAIGHKALAVNLSDIAAMGGDARWFTLALSLPEPDPEWLQAFSDGLLSLAKEVDVRLVGGDTTRGELSITISVMGTAPDAGAIRRSGARPGDSIFVTGSPGFAAMGLAALKGMKNQSAIERVEYVNKLNYPQARLLEGQFLRAFATSMIDVSDGLAADLGHILQASNCSAFIDSEKLKNLQPQSSSVPKKQFLEAALYGGDDYELLFTIPPEKIMMFEQNWLESFSCVTRLGEITPGEGLIIKDSNGKNMNIDNTGYNHFHE
jgi:thiamine-monophosphate kinase